MRKKTTALPKASGVYQIRCRVTGALYVGSAKTMSLREAIHRCYLKQEEHPNRNLQRLHVQFDALVFEVVELCEVGALRVREQHWMDAKREAGEQLVNLHPSARGPQGFTHSKETKELQSAALKGRVFSDEHRAKLSASKKAAAALKKAAQGASP